MEWLSLSTFWRFLQTDRAQYKFKIESKVCANTQKELQIMKFTGKCFRRLTLHRSLAKTHDAFKNIKVESLSPFCVIALVSFSEHFYSREHESRRSSHNNDDSRRFLLPVF